MVEWVNNYFGFVVIALFLVLWVFGKLPLAGEDEFIEAGKTAIKENHGTKVVVSQAYSWEPMDTCPLGCKVQLKTIPGGIATYGEVNERNRKHFSAWAPLPTTRKP
jgi:hypothetical protein